MWLPSMKPRMTSCSVAVCHNLRIGFVHGRHVGVRCRTTVRSVKESWRISSTGLGVAFKLHVEASQQ